MTTAKITAREVEALAPGKTLWDTAVKGFGARRQRNAVVYVYKDRQNGRQRFITIGKHGGAWTPATARAEARRLAGIPPGAISPHAGQTFGELARAYVERHARIHKKSRSLTEDRRNLELHILPVLGSLPLAAVTRDLLSRFHAERHAQPANANRCLALVSHIFTMAERWGITSAGSNPCRGLERYRELPRERYLSQEELRRLGQVLRAAKDQPGQDWRTISALELLLLTGARLTEILALEWRFIDWELGFARLPDGKSGPRTLCLPRDAMAVLQQVRNDHRGQGRFVFPGKKRDSYFTGIQKPWQRLRRDAQLDDVRIHDLRHSFASLAVAKGESLYLVGHVLGHRRAITTQRYAHLALQPVLDSANRTSALLAALLGP